MVIASAIEWVTNSTFAPGSDAARDTVLALRDGLADFDDTHVTGSEASSIDEATAAREALEQEGPVVEAIRRELGEPRARLALIGPGVDASHAYERTHQESILHCTHLIACYLLT